MTSTSEKKPSGGRKKNETKKAGSAWRTGTWIGLLVFISVWMFIFGILVGRGTVSTQIALDGSQKAIHALAAKAAQEAEKPGLDLELSDKSVLDPFDELKSSDAEGMQKDNLFLKKPDRPKPVAPKSSRKTKKPAKQTVPPKKAAARPAPRKPAPVASQKPPAPKPKPKPKAIVNSSRTLQAASMQNLAAAKQMVAQLRQKGYKAYVASATIPGQGMRHRVRIGPFKNDSDAQAALKKLKKNGINGIMLK